MLSLLREKSVEVLQAIAPLIGVVCLLQVTLVQAPIELFLHFLAGSGLASIGMLLLLAGIDFGILPMGRFVGGEIPKRESLALIIAVAVAMGFATTVAEPDVLVLASQVEVASEGAMSRHAVVYVIALGFAAFAGIAMARIVTGWPMRHVLTVAYALMLALSLVAPAAFGPLAYDAGSVTTGVLSGPVMIALAIGLASVLAGRSALSDGFGLVGFGSIGPIIVILIMGIVLS
jgi:hypothetical protein